MRTFILIWKSLRPKQWSKNLFVFSALLFSQNILSLPPLLNVLSAFFVFCLLSGSLYVLNDIVDIEQDKNHPLKSYRPLASGKLNISHAKVFLVFIIPLSLGISYYLNLSFFIVALSYFLLQIAYTFSLKHIIILDVLAIASGFVLRVVAGAVVIDVDISSWLLICTLLLSLFLGLSKRRHELIVLEKDAHSHRNVLKDYSPYLLDQMISVVSSSTVMAYALYTISDDTIDKFGTENLIFTVPFVLYGIFRYLYLIHQKEEGGDPENILVSDKPLMIDILLWVLASGIILYL